MSSQNQTIAILDSGVGGLSIFVSVRATLPQSSIIYGCDNKNFPYGPKNSISVINCITDFAQKVLNQFSPELIVIACNTASTVALEELRRLTSTPIVGVVPAIKPAALKSQSKVIGLLATPGTVQREYTEKLILEHASDCTVIKVGSTRLVELAEEKLRGKRIDLNEIRRELAPFFKTSVSVKVDTIVLGCTHFPLLLEELESVVPYPIHWIDSSEAIAQRVETLADFNQALPPIYTAAFSEMNDYAKALAPQLRTLGFSQILELR